MNESILERVNKCKRTFMLSELVDLQRVQSVRMPNDVEFLHNSGKWGCRLWQFRSVLTLSSTNT